jgi:hypothetical protein
VLVPFLVAFGLAFGLFRVFEAWSGCAACTPFQSGPMQIAALFIIAGWALSKWRSHRLRQAIHRKSVGSTSTIS